MCIRDRCVYVCVCVRARDLGYGARKLSGQGVFCFLGANYKWNFSRVPRISREVKGLPGWGHYIYPHPQSGATRSPTSSDQPRPTNTQRNRCREGITLPGEARPCFHHRHSPPALHSKFYHMCQQRAGGRILFI